MHIAFIEIANFRKLRSVRIELDKATTLFVGANNSGKTSAIIALRHFLSTRGGFSANDFTISHRKEIIALGNSWIKNAEQQEPQSPDLADWADLVPTMDVWLDAKDTDLHYVSHILPTLDWSGGHLGVRLRLQPQDVEKLYREFVESIKGVEVAKAGAQKKDGKPIEVKLWPIDLFDFLSRRLGKHFKISSYILDPDKVVPPQNGIATMQTLPADAEAIVGDPFADLILIDEIPAQRGFLDASAEIGSRDSSGEARQLAKQFADYFAKHLNPQDKPDASDIVALQAIEEAQKAYDERLKHSFSGPLKEMEGLGYPGVTDPRVTIRTRLRPVDGLDHDSSVQYEVAALAEAAAILPEDYNGLGYQNLICMVFKLMSFRDAWMRVGKAKTDEQGTELGNYPPLHLVLVEEPEAHLHVQVQQVFIRKAYDVLRNHPMLGVSSNFCTQLVVSSHSSHVAHEVEFSCIRYFKRLPAGYPAVKGTLTSVPISTVVNLSDAFGDEVETGRFAKRYLRVTHCDLFFADAVIFVEGSAERILVPHFVLKGNDLKYLSHCYISWLEVGGSHSHKLRPLIERLGVLTLVITDIDACDPAKNRKATRPIPGQGQETNNTTLRSWLPKRSKLDELLGLSESDKIIHDEPLFAVRVAYQVPIEIERQGKNEFVVPYTFEDAVALENISIIQQMTGTGLLGEFAALSCADSDAAGLAQSMFEALDGKKKAEFALDILTRQVGPSPFRCPRYISEGLSWLQVRLEANKAEILDAVVGAAEEVGVAVAKAIEVESAEAVLDLSAVFAAQAEPDGEGLWAAKGDAGAAQE